MIPSTVGMVIRLKNIKDHKQTIKRFHLLCGSAEIDNLGITHLKNDDLDSSTDINKLLNDKYQLIISKNDNNCNLELESQEELVYLLPVSYLNFLVVNKAGILIETENGYQLIDVMPIFNSSLLNAEYVVNKFAKN